MDVQSLRGHNNSTTGLFWVKALYHNLYKPCIGEKPAARIPTASLPLGMTSLVKKRQSRMVCILEERDF
jgi:hypothetical protein